MYLSSIWSNVIYTLGSTMAHKFETCFPNELDFSLHLLCTVQWWHCSITEQLAILQFRVCSTFLISTTILLLLLLNLVGSWTAPSDRFSKRKFTFNHLNHAFWQKQRNSQKRTENQMKVLNSNKIANQIHAFSPKKSVNKVSKKEEKKESIC